MGALVALNLVEVYLVIARSRYHLRRCHLVVVLVVAAVQSAGLDVLRWSDDPRDWSRPGAVAIAQRVLLRLRPGAVVLLHDGGGNRRQTVQVLRWLFRALRAAG